MIGGEVSERFKVPISKIGRSQKGLVGSNPTLSATTTLHRRRMPWIARAWEARE